MRPLPLSVLMEERWRCFYAGLEDARRLWRAARWVAYWLLVRLLRRLPAGAAAAFGDWLGRVAFWALTRYRKRSIENIGDAFPGAEGGWVRSVAQASMRGLGRGFGQAVSLGRMSLARRRALAQVSGLEHLEAALRSGRGAVVLSAHLGCWEFLPAFLAATGRETAVVVEPQAGALETALLRSERERLNVREIEPTLGHLRAAVRMAARGGLVVCPFDRGVGRGGVSVRFMGRATALPALPLRLARAARVAILPAYTTRMRGGHSVVFEEPVEIGEAGEISAVASVLAATVERWIRLRPAQWVWLDVKGD